MSSRIPRSQSQSFVSRNKGFKVGGAKAPIPKGMQPPIRVEKAKPKVQAPTSPTTVITPANLTASFKPTQKLRIDRTIKRSISFTRNGEELNLHSSGFSSMTPSSSDMNISGIMSPSVSMEFPVKEIYTFQEMLAMKPQQYQKKLMSPGYIMLLHLKSSKKNQNGPDRMQKRKKPNRKPSQTSNQPVLRTHSGDRFLSSSASKEVGMYDAKSSEAIRTDAQRILNRMNSRTIEKCINDIRKTGIKMDDLIHLLLERATMDTEFPERNVQLANFILFAINYSNNNMMFADSLIKQSYEAADKLIGEPQMVPIASFQCMAVWLSTLFKAGMGEEHVLYEFFNKVMITEAKERAIDVLRCGLYICGEKVGPNFKIFFDFLANHPSQFGYKRFLVEDLFALRDNGWKKEQTEKKETSSSLHIEFSKKPEQSKEDPHDVDNADIIEGEYRRWLREEEFEFTKFQPDPIIRLTLRVLTKHFKDANTFVQYAASILSNSSKDNGRIVDIIKDYFTLYTENVRVEENPGMWVVYFMLLASYFAEGIIKFELIQELLLKANETEFPPRMKIVVFRMAEVTGAPMDKIIQFKEAIGEPIMSDPEFNQSLVALAEYTPEEGESEIECGKKSLIHGGVLVRDVISAALQDDVEDPEAVISESKELLKAMFELYGRNMISVAKHILTVYQLEPEKKERLINFIESNIFESN